jgi:single-strand DNA-binding protein
MATTEKWNNKDGSPEEHTEWHNIVCWNKLAEIVEKYLSKGKQVYIEGRLRTREWTDNEGGKRRTVEVIAGQMVMLGSRSDTSAPTSYQKPTEVVDDGSITDDDIPF